MKTSLKVILTILLAVAAVMSIVSMLLTGLAVLGAVFSIVSAIMPFFQDATVNYISLVFSVLGSITSIGLNITFALLFLVIALACVVGIVYVFIGGSDKRIKELEAVINAAYTETPEPCSATQSCAEEVEGKQQNLGEESSQKE